ncbi:MAG: hypothetical protein ABR992_08915 [Solirubrobacteraceae bacterium]
MTSVADIVAARVRVTVATTGAAFTESNAAAAACLFGAGTAAAASRAALVAVAFVKLAAAATWSGLASPLEVGIKMPTSAPLNALAAAHIAWGTVWPTPTIAPAPANSTTSAVPTATTAIE